LIRRGIGFHQRTSAERHFILRGEFGPDYAEFRIMPSRFPTNSPSLNSHNNIQPQSI
jgi:hypothetical protein